MDTLRIGIIGCGAVTVRSHLPAMARIDGAEVVALVDTQLDRVRDIAASYGVPAVSADYTDILDNVDAVILALPHHLHAPIGEEVLNAGKHVLMEKPLANTVAECEALLDVTNKSGVTLSVGQVRRYMQAYQAAREWIASGLLGDITRFEAEEGNVYNWPVASDFFFRPEMSGGGVLMDTGAHVLDALSWWLGGIEIVGYADDSMGGVEADCSVELKSSHGVSGTLELSRARMLDNNCVFHGTLARLEVSLHVNEARLIPHDGSPSLIGGFDADSPQSTVDLFVEQAVDWVARIHGQPSEIASGEDGLEVVRLISACYQNRQPVDLVWRRFQTAG